MKNILKVIYTIFILSFSISILSWKVMPEKSIGNFKLLNVDGKEVSLSDYPTAKGFIVIFTCNHCPFAKLYPSRINDLNARYKALGVPVIAISSTDTIMYENDGYLAMKEKAEAEHFNFPYLYDSSQLVARNFGAQKTPHAYVVWKENNKLVIKYNGAIDDNGTDSKNVTKQYVVDAVDLLLKGKPVINKETKSIGCQIYFRKRK